MSFLTAPPKKAGGNSCRAAFSVNHGTDSGKNGNKHCRKITRGVIDPEADTRLSRSLAPSLTISSGNQFFGSDGRFSTSIFPRPAAGYFRSFHFILLAALRFVIDSAVSGTAHSSIIIVPYRHRSVNKIL